MGVEVFKQGLELFADQWQAPGSIDFYSSGDLDDYISFSVTSNRPLITGTGNYLVLGKDGTAGSATSADDVLVGGKLEVDGVLYADGGIVGGTSFNMLDDILFTLGTNNDQVLLNRSSILNADTTLTGVVVGASRETQAIAADSLMISNITSNGDIAMYVNKGGHTQMVLWADGSTGDTAILAASGQSVDMYIGGSKIFDLTNDGTKSTLMGLSGDYWRIGDAATTNHSLNSEDDLMVTGELEVDGDAMFDGTTITFGVSSNVAIFSGITMADTKAIKTPSGGTGDYFLLQAYDEDLTGLVEAARVFSANDPYFSMGGSQEFKFYNSGEANFGGKSPQNCDSINAIAYTQILEILGDASMFLPFSEATGSTVTDWTANGLDATTSETLQTFDTPPAFVGSQYAYDFNGVDEEMDVADNALSSTAGAMSAGAWVNMTDSTNSTLFGVWDINSKREWRLYLDASDYPTFAVYDEGNAAQLGRQDQTALSEGAWKFVVATFDGGTAAGGITVYIDGVALDDADVLVGSGYADQVDSGAALDIGFNEDGSSAPENYFDGLMWGPWMTKKELSADEVWNLYKIGKGLLDQ